MTERRALARPLRLAAAMTAAALVGACVMSEPTAAPTATPPGLASGTPGARSTVLALAVDTDPGYVSLAYNPDDDGSARVVSLVYDGLYRLDSHVQPVPDLAAGVPAVSSDGLTWTISLRTGVRWQDGSALTASDVAFTYALLLSDGCPVSADPTDPYNPCAVMHDHVASVVESANDSVVFHLKDRFAPLLTYGLTVPIMPQAAVTASWGRLKTSLGGADAAQVRAEVVRIQNGRSDSTCSTDTPGPECDSTTYVGEVEPLIRAAGLQLPAQPTSTDASTPDRGAYADALIQELSDLDATLQAGPSDQVAAAFRLLDFQRQPLGSGPYRLQGRVAGQSLDLVRNDDYFGGPVAYTGVHVVVSADPTTSVTMLRQGDVQWVPSVGAEAVPELLSDATVQVAEFPSVQYQFVAFNTRAGHIYSDVRLRQAFAACIDKQQAVSVATEGRGMPIWSLVPPYSWAFDPSLATQGRDPAAARRLIEAAGWTRGSDGIYQRNGIRLSTQFYVRVGQPERTAFAQEAKRELVQCGIEIKVREVDLLGVILPLMLYPNNFDTMLMGTLLPRDPDVLARFGTAEVTDKANPYGNNPMGWTDPETDELIALGREVVDTASRAAVYRRLQEHLAQELPVYPLWVELDDAALSRRVVSRDGQLDLSSPLYDWNVATWQGTP